MIVADFASAKHVVCPIGHKDKKTRHKHEAYGDTFRHEEDVKNFARVYLAFQINPYAKKGIVVTAAINCGVVAMGTVMPPSYYKKSGIKPNSDPERARSIGRRITKLLRQSRMVKKIKTP